MSSDKPRPEGPLLVDQLRFMAQHHADEPGYIDLDAQPDAHVQAMGRPVESGGALARRQTACRRATRVAIALPNEYCLRWIVAYAGVHKAGAGDGAGEHRLSTPEMVAILGHAEISVLFTCAGLLEHARAVRAAVPSLRAIVCADGHADGVLGWDDEIAGGRRERDEVPVDEDDMADIMYTSGTTGPAERCARPAPATSR